MPCQTIEVEGIGAGIDELGLDDGDVDPAAPEHEEEVEFYAKIGNPTNRDVIVGPRFAFGNGGLALTDKTIPANGSTELWATLQMNSDVTSRIGNDVLTSVIELEGEGKTRTFEIGNFRVPDTPEGEGQGTGGDEEGDEERETDVGEEEEETKKKRKVLLGLTVLGASAKLYSDWRK